MFTTLTKPNGPFKILDQIAKTPMAPPGFESNYSSSDSEPESNQYIIKPSEALTKSGLKMEPDLPSSSSHESDSDEPGTGFETNSDGPDPKLSAMAPKKLNGGVGKKRAAEGEALEANKSKQNRAQFERLFSEEDEIALLNGMIRFAEKNKVAPFADLDAFRGFVKADLSVDPTKDQLKHKMRKFKTKYDKNMSKQASGSARSLKAHERRAFDLSKLVWANEYIKGQKMVRSPKAAGKKRAKAETTADVAENGGGVSKVSAGKKRAKAEQTADVAENGGSPSKVSAGKKRVKAKEATDVAENGGDEIKVSADNKRAKSKEAADVAENGGGEIKVLAGKKKAKSKEAADVAENGGGEIKMSAGNKRAKSKEAADVAENGGGACKVSLMAEILSLREMRVSRIGDQLFEGVEGDDEWVELKKAEMEVYLKQMELMCTKTRLVLDMLKAN
ncbi:hypothetical protein CASFOL_031629 [Castilleja foliolosa]|uniref:Glabrous enhancer-binding protein-like DBD domain-containing protein n=1 Tax=Castilleja foliolosa TaxID=1961234 RepID=A0ABD3C6J0_9LAMI